MIEEDNKINNKLSTKGKEKKIVNFKIFINNSNTHIF